MRIKKKLSYFRRNKVGGVIKVQGLFPDICRSQRMENGNGVKPDMTLLILCFHTGRTLRAGSCASALEA